jgi:hypothetical protein
MSKSGYRVWIGIALCHLILVSLGASYVNISDENWVGRAVNIYDEVSGAGSSYGFFAPGIFSQIRAVFDVIDANGQTRTVNLAKGINKEADLRVGNIIDQFQSIDEVEDGDDERIERLQRSMAASLAGTIFGRYPGAKKVVLRLEKFQPPSMEEYRRGERPNWEPLYSAAFISGAE